MTGASGGIGEELARLFAADGHDLVLVARGEEKLRRLAEELGSKHNVAARVLASDLSRAEAPREIFDELAREGVTVDALVNNAGIGSWGLFAETDLKQELELLQINVVALTHLTKLFLPPMMRATPRLRLQRRVDGGVPARPAHGRLLRLEGLRALALRGARERVRGDGRARLGALPRPDRDGLRRGGRDGRLEALRPRRDDRARGRGGRATAGCSRARPSSYRARATHCSRAQWASCRASS